MAKNKLSSRRSKTTNDLSAEQQEKALQKMRGEKERGKFYGRVTVDFPHDVYDDMKELIKEEGRTMKGYLLNLVKKDLKSKQ